MLAFALLVACLQLVIGLPVQDGPVDFTKYQVIKILPKDTQNVETLKNLIHDHQKSIDFWNRPREDLRPVLSLIGPNDNNFLVTLNSSSIKYEVVSHNFQRMIDAEREENDKASVFASTFDYENKYHTYSEIKNELNAITSQSSKATYKSVGKSFEGRDIPALVLTNSGSSDKQTIFFECGIHAREWISVAACMYMANKLLTDPKNSELLDKYEFIIVPSLNVDGYAYTWEHNRSWRMTRSRTAGTNCVGADPNRNWDVAWCKYGASSKPCDETYCGSKPFSEVEAKHMSELVLTRKGRIAAYFAFHSFSEFWMYPYGYTSQLPPNAKRLDELSKIGVNAIRASHGLSFTYGNIYDVIYPASGSSIDWVYDKGDAKITFALELRDRGNYGFVLPPTQIKPACEETWAGIRAVIEAL